MLPCVIASISDIHLGHRSNPTLNIIAALDKVIFEDRLLEKIDLLILAGDIYERLLDLNHPDIGEIDMWMSRVLRGCHKHKVALRVLRGTRSHDWDQPQRFELFYEMLKLDIDFKYVDTLEIEYMTALDAHVLYVPDNYKHDSSETLEEVRELLRARALDKVDISIMHGMFDYQQPEGIRVAEAHDSAAYMSFTRHFIFIGHVHTHSVVGNAIAQGSFDRLKHGEEEPKGFVIAYIDEDNGNHVFFVENTKARIYKTVQCYKMDLESTLRYIEEVTTPLPGDSAVRIEAEPDHPLFSNMHELDKLFPTITWSKLPKQKDETMKETVVVSTSEFDEWSPVVLTRENIVDVLMKRLETKITLDADKLFVQEQLQELR